MAEKKVIVVVKADEKRCGDPHHRLCHCGEPVPRGHYATSDRRHVVIVIREAQIPFEPDGGH